MAFWTDNYRTPKQIDWEKFQTQKNAFETGDPEFSGSIKARVPKFSDVKPGQQHPVGKHGQGKLFHEHVWPKGYTPQRRAEIGEAMPYLHSHTEKSENDPVWGPQSPQREKAFVYDTIARSTMDADELRAMTDYNNMEIHTGVNLPKGIAGEYHPGGESPISDNEDSGAILLKNPKQNFDTYGGALTGKTLIHEIGHAMDEMSDPMDFDRNRDENAMYRGQNQFLPAAEGRAMGYQLAKFRATRKQVRTMRQSESNLQGYQPEHITDSKYSDNRVPARETFKSNRIKAFRVARGEEIYPEKAPVSKKEPKYDQPRLPGM
jgi:hypothetical protein